MKSPREHLIEWLRDAHAMEEQAKSLLNTQIDRLENYPEMLGRLQTHLDETEHQRAMIEECLHRLGTDTSTTKDLATKFMANMQGLGHMMSSDEVLKNAIASYTFEQFEQICYHSLIAAAETANEPEVARVARDILTQEEAMADWIWQSVPGLTRKFLEREAAGEPAKV